MDVEAPKNNVGIIENLGSRKGSIVPVNLRLESTPKGVGSDSSILYSYIITATTIIIPLLLSLLITILTIIDTATTTTLQLLLLLLFLDKLDLCESWHLAITKAMMARGST